MNIPKTRPSGAWTGHPGDLVPALVIPEDVWYIIPVKLVVKGRMGMIILSPSVAGHKYEAYMEAWHLLGDHTVVVSCA
ncbi:MAG: hypothetical protein WA637_19270 [Terriglobales bacterium]